jgi:hypothetical protein
MSKHFLKSFGEENGKRSDETDKFGVEQAPNEKCDTL